MLRKLKKKIEAVRHRSAREAAAMSIWNKVIFLPLVASPHKFEDTDGTTSN